MKEKWMNMDQKAFAFKAAGLHLVMIVLWIFSFSRILDLRYKWIFAIGSAVMVYGWVCWELRQKGWEQAKHIREEQERQQHNGVALDQAILREELVVYYQPVVNVETEEIEGVEALLRWIHPEKGFIPPDEFVPMAESVGKINSLDDWLLEKVCEDWHHWQQNGLLSINLSMNLSMHQFSQKDLAERIIQRLAAFSIPPDKFVVEITESAALHNQKQILDTLATFRENGIKVALDDFGTGFSSPDYLRVLPVDILKIDKSFIRDLEGNQKTAMMVQRIIEVAHEFNISVTAEGVEDENQRAVLQVLKCDRIQGYYYHRPMPAAELEKLLGAFPRVQH